LFSGTYGTSNGTYGLGDCGNAELGNIQVIFIMIFYSLERLFIAVSISMR